MSRPPTARGAGTLDRRIVVLTALRDQLDGCLGLSLAAAGPGARLLPGAGDIAGNDQ